MIRVAPAQADHAAVYQPEAKQSYAGALQGIFCDNHGYVCESTWAVSA